MVHTIDSIGRVREDLKKTQKTIVLATGFFDLLHQEHVIFLSKAKAAGDILIVAVESDVRARQVKGDSRPIQTQVVRCQKLEELKTSGIQGYGKTEVRVIDYVIALTDDFDNQVAYDHLMATIRPHVYAVSSHTKYLENKRILTEKYGGKLMVVHDWNPAVSTTQILASKKNGL